MLFEAEIHKLSKHNEKYFQNTIYGVIEIKEHLKKHFKRS